jgi:hypothetical protein
MTDSERDDVLDTKITALRELVDERDRRYEDRFNAVDEKTTLALSTSKEANNKSEAATEKRFDSHNEFRGQLKDQAATFMPRAEADARFKSIEEKIEDSKNKTHAFGQWTFQQVLLVILVLGGWAVTTILFLMRRS